MRELELRTRALSGLALAATSALVDLLTTHLARHTPLLIVLQTAPATTPSRSEPCFPPPVT